MSNIVENYGWTTLAGPQSCGYIGPAVIEILKSLPVRRVIDIGSGNGVLCNLLLESGYTVAGVEYDKQGFLISRNNYPKINFYNLGVGDDPSEIMKVEREPFDLVVSTEVIEHLFSPHLLPEFASRLLVDRGYLVISTPYHGYLKNLALSIFDKWDHHHTALWHGGHIKFWSRNTLTSLLEKSGFELVEFHGVGRAPFLWKSMIIVARKI